MAEMSISDVPHEKQYGRRRSIPPWVIDAGAAVLAESDIKDKWRLANRVFSVMLRARITQEWLREVLNYDQETGLFEWRRQLSYRAPVGSRAGSVKPSGYVHIEIVRRRYVAHHLAWLYVTGEWPTEMVDHWDGNKSNNAWKNLRQASRIQNAANSKLHKDNLLRLKGVSRNTRDGRTKPYFARIKLNGSVVHLGSFAAPEEAHRAYCEAAKAAHGDFAREE